MVRLQNVGLPGFQDALPLGGREGFEHGRVDLVFGQQVRLARLAAQEIGLRGLAESQRLGDGGGGGRFLAEHYHVGEVRSRRVFRRLVFAEDTARGEHGLDRANDESRGREGEVSGVILTRCQLCLDSL